jgi:hypothetical protein
LVFENKCDVLPKLVKIAENSDHHIYPRKTAMKLKVPMKRTTGDDQLFEHKKIASAEKALTWVARMF